KIEIAATFALIERVLVMGGGLAGRRLRLKPSVGGVIATQSQERFVANCSDSRNRHCERSEAIHLSVCAVTLDCFASLAMTWLPPNTTPQSRGAMRPSC
ncbi:MAG: hypothetical protein ABWY82_28505, partial [Tardiphaga sp.]